MSNKELFFNTYLDKISDKFAVHRNIAFEIFSQAVILEKTFDEIEKDVLIKGKQDGGIDGVHFTEYDGYYVMDVFQCKNSKSLNQKQLEKFQSDFESIFIKGKRDKPNSEDLLPKLDEYEDITKRGNRIEHRLVFVFSGEVDDPDYSANQELYQSFHRPGENFYIYDSNAIDRKIGNLVKQSSRREEIRFVFEAEPSNISLKDPQALMSYSILNIKAVNFRMSALKLCELVDLEIQQNGLMDKLFSENIRGFLGYKTTANKKNLETLQSEESVYFPFLNNGITILCDEVTVPTNAQAGKYIIPAKNPVVVNGMQTTSVIYDIYKQDRSLLENVFLSVRLYETKEPELIDRITEATNTQTPIKFSDKLSNKKFHAYVKEIFANKNVGYLTKRGDLFTNRLSKEMHDSITSEKLLKFWYATFYEKPEVAKNSISKVMQDIFDATNGGHVLDVLFQGDQDAAVYSQLYITYLLYSFVTRKRREWSDREGFDFIKYCDELLSYGIYKYLEKEELTLDESHFEQEYEKVALMIKEKAEEEKSRRESAGESFSFSSYFKNQKSRDDLNEKLGLVEDYYLVDDLQKKRYKI